MTLTEAAQILGLKISGLTREAVQKAFREKVKIYHPDVGGTHEDMLKLNEARDILFQYVKDTPGAEQQQQQKDWNFDEIFREYWERTRQEAQREQRREQEKKRKEWEEKARERKRYTEGVKKSYESDVERFKKIIVEHADNPAFWKAVEDVAGQKGWRLYFSGYNLFFEYKKFYAAKQMYDQLFTDKSTYQAVYRAKKDGTQAGPYWYRVKTEKGKTKREYVGMNLPKSAMGEPLAGKRSEKCWQMAREWAEKAFKDI